MLKQDLYIFYWKRDHYHYQRLITMIPVLPGHCYVVTEVFIILFYNLI